MIKSFKHKGLERFFLTGKKSGINPEHGNRIRLILARLHASTSPRDMSLPGLQLHPLQGKWNDFYAVSVSGNWRIVFRFQDHDVFDVNYVDYH